MVEYYLSMPEDLKKELRPFFKCEHLNLKEISKRYGYKIPALHNCIVIIGDMEDLWNDYYALKDQKK